MNSQDENDGVPVDTLYSMPRVQPEKTQCDGLGVQPLAYMPRESLSPFAPDMRHQLMLGIELLQ